MPFFVKTVGDAVGATTIYVGDDDDCEAVGAAVCLPLPTLPVCFGTVGFSVGGGVGRCVGKGWLGGGVGAKYFVGDDDGVFVGYLVGGALGGELVTMGFGVGD